MKSIISVTLSLFSFFFLQAQTLSLPEPALLIAEDRGYNHGLGTTVGISGDYAIIGAPNEGEQDPGAQIPSFTSDGAAYIFERQPDGDWVQVQKLGEAARQPGRHFGEAVAIFGNYAVVGSSSATRDPDGQNEYRDAGIAYIYERDESGFWTLVRKIVPSDRRWEDAFGSSVAIYGETIAVGAPGKEIDGDPGAGAVYLFERNASGAWLETQILISDDAAWRDNFGTSVALDDTHMLIGAYFKGEGVFKGAGAAYVFERTEGGSWQQAQKLLARDKSDDDFFGKKVAIHQGMAVIGAPNKDTGSSSELLRAAGAAYVFQADETGRWRQTQKLLASDREGSDNFGTAVAIGESYLLVGAHLESGIGQPHFHAGAAYVFVKGDDGMWEEDSKIVEPARHTGNTFGFAVAMSEKHFFIGCPGKNEIPPEEPTPFNVGGGAGYIYALPHGTGSQGRQLLAYPNPTTGPLFIDLVGFYPKIRITISDLTGRIVHQKFLFDQNIIETEIPGGQGFYFVEVLSPEGVVGVVKVLKK